MGGGIDFVVEAVFEDLELKRRILREIESNVSPDCLIATNTSSLPIGEIGRVADHPGRFLGVHFFNPVHRMPLIEIVAAKPRVGKGGLDPGHPVAKIPFGSAFAADLPRQDPVSLPQAPGQRLHRHILHPDPGTFSRDRQGDAGPHDAGPDHRGTANRSRGIA